MRVALAALAVAALLVAPASAATRTLHAHVVAPAAYWLGSANGTTAAYATPDGRAALRADDGTTRTIAPPEGCGFSAAGSGLLASACGRGAAAGPDSILRPLAVSRLDGSIVTRIEVVGQTSPAGGGEPGSPVAIGAQWLRSVNSSYHGGAWWEDVNWHTGEVRESYETDPRMLADLDRPELAAPLCSPLRRVRTPQDYQEAYTALQPVTVRGRWALIESLDGATLRHCGLARPVKLPARFNLQALGDGWVAGFRDAAPDRTARLELVRLADRRRFAVAGVPVAIARGGYRYALTFTAGRLYVHTNAAGPLATITLPRR